MNHAIKPPDWSGARGERWLGHLNALEATIAPVNEALFRGLDVRTPARIADIGSGGGDGAKEIARRAPEGSSVTGFDISPVLVEAAQKLDTPKGRSLSFEIADAQTTKPAALYDRLSSRFGVMFFADPDQAFANLRQWLKPDGAFAFAVWGPLANNPWMGVVHDCVAACIELSEPPADTPGPYRYANAGFFTEVLSRAGFQNLEVHEWNGKLPVGGGLPAREAAKFSLSAFSVAHPLADAEPAAQDRALDLLTDAYAAFEENGQVHADAHVHIVKGSV